MEWKEQYKHPLWQKKRLDALDAAGFCCQNCGESESQLHVHHVVYKKKSKIWEYENDELHVLCDRCHLDAHSSKEGINKFLILMGPGSESFANEFLYGYWCYSEFGGPSVHSWEAMLGYAAAYLGNIHSDDVLKLTKIRPDLLIEFIKENG